MSRIRMLLSKADHIWEVSYGIGRKIHRCSEKRVCLWKFTVRFSGIAGVFSQNDEHLGMVREPKGSQAWNMECYEQLSHAI